MASLAAILYSDFPVFGARNPNRFYNLYEKFGELPHLNTQYEVKEVKSTDQKKEGFIILRDPKNGESKFRMLRLTTAIGDKAWMLIPGDWVVFSRDEAYPGFIKGVRPEGIK